MAAKKETLAIRREVDEVMERRERALKARRKALAEVTILEAVGEAVPVTPHMELAVEANQPAKTKGWLVAEGDSWFDYPGSDILDWLHQFGYDVESVARAGDHAEMMAFGRGQLDKLAIAIEKVIAVAPDHKPRAILLSGGGNDIAGAQFGFLLNHAGSPNEGLNESIVKGVIDERVQEAYEHIIRKVTELCRRMVGTEVRIVMHGYGYPIPDGDGVLGGFGPLPGPWLRPGFIEKGFGDLTANKATMKRLIDRFNDMVERVAALFPHTRYVNLRPLLPAEKKHWANELHPKPPGCRPSSTTHLMFARER
jgi:hypothetical protein